ncbi:unnamed protein product [Acanthosepion pharaonis]|uniref:Uncharacterized protein n=1 Tax=Acanthosepion pharaonis TaxID=158019 RepID=A0A812DYD5_ACAPH|nr:unnamed protein product [Sepia pharaonis]
MDVATPADPNRWSSPRSGATSAKSSGAGYGTRRYRRWRGSSLRKADQDAAALGFGMEGRAAAAAWRREMRRPQQRRQPCASRAEAIRSVTKPRIAFIVEMLGAGIRHSAGNDRRAASDGAGPARQRRRRTGVSPGRQMRHDARFPVTPSPRARRG